MEKVAFTIGGALSFAWDKVKQNLNFFLGFAVILAIYQFGNGYLSNVYFSERNFEAGTVAWEVFFVYMLLNFIVSMVFTLWQARISIDAVDGNTLSLDSIQKVTPLIFRAFVANIVFTIIIFVGFLLLIVPGIIWAVKYMFVFYNIVDKDMGVFEALEESGRITKGEKWHLLGFGFVMGIVVLLGVLALGVGVLVSYPVAIVAQGYVYRQLQKANMHTDMLQSGKPE